MNIACPECETVYRLDPRRVPEGGARTRCRECNTVFRVEPESEERPGEVRVAALAAAGHPGSSSDQGMEAAGGATAAPADASDHLSGPPPEQSTTATATTAPGAAAASRPGGAGAPPDRPAFGPQDPDTRARRLARALVSDIKVYNADRWRDSLSGGTLRKDFRDEILKSWQEYVEQVGEPLAKKTPYFRNALNDILAEGQSVF